MVFGVDRHRRRELDLLPAGGRLAGEGGLGEERAGRRPQVSDVRAGVARALVEAQAGDLAGDIGAELDPELDRRRIVFDRWDHGVAPDRARTARGDHLDGDSGARRLEVAAVVHGSGLDRGLTGLVRAPRVGPVPAPFGRMPGAVADLDLDPADLAPARVGGGAGDRRLLVPRPRSPRSASSPARSAQRRRSRRSPRPDPTAGCRGGHPCPRTGSRSPAACGNRAARCPGRGCRRGPTTTARYPRRIRAHHSRRGTGSGCGSRSPSHRSIRSPAASRPRSGSPRTAGPTPAAGRRCRRPRPTRSRACSRRASRCPRAPASRDPCCATVAACPRPPGPRSPRCRS